MNMKNEYNVGWTDSCCCGHGREKLSIVAGLKVDRCDFDSGCHDGVDRLSGYE